MHRPARFLFVLALFTPLFVGGQGLVSPTDRDRFNSLFDSVDGQELKCDLRSYPPFIDFAFRFNLGYEVSCDVRQFEGKSGELRSFLRVRSEKGPEMILGDAFTFQAMPEEMAGKVNLAKIRADLQFSGALAAGEGRYKMELLVFDNRARLFRHTWNVKAEPHGDEHKITLSMQPGSMVPLRTSPLPVVSNSDGAARVTVLLNAAPLNPRSTKLRAWDRAFLLEALASTLHKLPYRSVRVIAFNLDQQREIFRQDDFSQLSMPKLNAALRNLELGTVSFHTLEKQRGWAELLLGLLRAEAAAKPSSDALIFLGPMAELYQKVPQQMLASYGEALPHVYCVTYYPRYGSEFPDTIQYLTSALKGRIFRIHTPKDLALNLDKLKQEIGLSAQP